MAKKTTIRKKIAKKKPKKEDPLPRYRIWGIPGQVRYKESKTGKHFDSAVGGKELGT